MATEQIEDNINEAHTEIVHENTIFAEPIFHIGDFTVTNSLVNSWVALILIVVVSLVLKSKIKLVPRGIQNFFEWVIEAFLDLFDSITGSREKSLRFFPFVFAFFMYVLFCNALGLLPGLGSIGQVVSEGEKLVFIPYLRAATADLNTTLALAIIGVVASHIIGVASIGFWNYLNKFINIKAILEIPHKVKEDITVLFVNPIKVFVGLLEIISEFAKLASLSLRLFGNVFAGEVLLATMSAILAFGLPLPFMFMEVLVAFVQALIFSVLVLSYLSMMSTAEEH